MNSHKKFAGMLALIFLIASASCSTLFPPDKPVVIIQSPPSGSQFHQDEEISVQSSSSDSKGVVRVELLVDGVVVDVDASPTATGQSSFTLLQSWKATNVGTHTLLVRAYNRTGIASDPAAISVTILQGVAQSGNPAPTTPSGGPPPSSPTPTVVPSPTPTSVGAPACVNNATFVADITVPDGTVVGPTQAFTKIWRVNNPAGGCSWGPGYQFIFVSGSAMTSSTILPVPSTPPGGVADLAVPLTAPTQPGNYTGSWRLRAPNAALFGATLSVKITVPGAPPPPPSVPPPACTGTPNAFTFSASASPINAGSSSNLQWGEVTNAESFEIDHGIGGQPTPGSTTVSPGSTTTYTATARCGANSRTAQVTITVNPAGPVAISRSSIGGSESGTVYAGGAFPVVHGTMLVGDTSDNKIARAYMSFDISDLSGKTINSANLNLTSCGVLRTPFADLAGIWVGEVQYAIPLDQADYNISGTGILLLNAKPNSTIDVKSLVQNRVNQSKSRFQIRLHPASANSDNDNLADYMSCGSGIPKLNITYQP